MRASAGRFAGIKTGSGGPLPIFRSDAFQDRSGLLSVDFFSQTGNLAGSGPLMKDSFFCRFIDDGFGDVEPLTGIICILSHGEGHILDDIFNPGLNGFVALAPLFALAGAFQC
jgi:hypothetical protein